MTSPEGRETGYGQEQEPAPYFQAASFAAEEPAGRAYFHAQATIFKRKECGLSVYRLQLNRVWHVAVLGEPPLKDLEEHIRVILSSGEPVVLPRDILQTLNKRRIEAVRHGPWVERHYRPGKPL